MFARVMVAVEDSPLTGRAVRLAARLVAPRRGRLLICSVVDRDRATPPRVPVTFRPHLRLDLERTAERTLKRAGRAVRGAGVRFETQVREGDVAEEIVAAARGFRAQLIVLASRPRGRLSVFVLGSRTHAVVNRSPCPVLLVPARPPRRR